MGVPLRSRHGIHTLQDVPTTNLPLVGYFSNRMFTCSRYRLRRRRVYMYREEHTSGMCSNANCAIWVCE